MIEILTYAIVATDLFPLGRITITLATPYDAFARLHGVGACEVQIMLPDGTTFDTPASIAIIDGGDMTRTQPRLLLHQRSHLAPFPEGSYCLIRPKASSP